MLSSQCEEFGKLFSVVNSPSFSAPFSLSLPCGSPVWALSGFLGLCCWYLFLLKEFMHTFLTHSHQVVMYRFLSLESCLSPSGSSSSILCFWCIPLSHTEWSIEFILPRIQKLKVYFFLRSRNMFMYLTALLYTHFVYFKLLFWKRQIVSWMLEWK